jgi:uncharacterized membrane protein (Fun14 family)
MRQILLLLFCVVVFSSTLSAQEGGVSINLDAPGNVVAGNDFEVTLRFNKGDLKDYSRFSQDLPPGFSASNVISPNADFTFTDQRIRIIWLKLPDEQEVEVKYAIDVHERLSGKLELSGTFAYVREGERAYMSLSEPVIVNILPNPDIDQGLVVDISEFHTISTLEATTEASTAPDNFDDAMVVGQEPVTKTTAAVQPEGSAGRVAGRSVPGTRSGAGPSVIDIAPLEAVSGVSFRVQVAAVRNPYFASVLFAENELLRDVKVEKQGGLNKYTAGPLSTYEDAVRLKNRITNETPVTTAFIVAYRNGVRVPVHTVK